MLTTSFILGVPDRTVMDMMGWSTTAMKQRYQHVTEGIRRDVAGQLNDYFWKATETPSETPERQTAPAVAGGDCFCW
jgi:hypothetical protein